MRPIAKRLVAGVAASAQCRPKDGPDSRKRQVCMKRQWPALVHTHYVDAGSGLLVSSVFSHILQCSGRTLSDDVSQVVHGIVVRIPTGGPACKYVGRNGHEATR